MKIDGGKDPRVQDAYVKQISQQQKEDAAAKPGVKSVEKADTVKISDEARELQEDQQRLDCLSVWKESALFSESEMAALDWAEGVTNISSTSNMDQRLKTMLKHYSEKEVVDLTYVVAVMNGLNRLAVSLGDKPPKRSA